MTKEEIIADERYHTCGRCRWGDLDDDFYPCNECIYGIDKREDFWEYAESEDKKEETEYQRQVEQYQYDTLYEPTFDLETGSM